jgi:hypothetical protein
MSNVSIAHDVVPFIAGKTAPFTGQRLAKVGYKTTAKTPALYPSIAVSVPKLSTETIKASIDALMPYVVQFVEDSQDKVIRSLYENASGKLSVVTDTDIGIDAIVSFLEAESAGDRLKKEHIESWFDRVCADNVFVLLAEKLGFTDPNADQEAVIKKNVAVYRSVLSMLAGGKTILTPVQIKSCKTVIDVSADDSGIGEKLLKRLTAMESPKQIADFLEL